jgi:acid phosphatase
MGLFQPTRRELITSLPLLAGAAAFGGPLAAQDSSSINFLVIGDWGRDGRYFQRQVAQLMGETSLAKRSVFVAGTGDNFYPLGVSSETDRQWWTSFEDIYTHEGLERLPWLGVLGNHDYGGRVQAQVGRTGVGRWYLPELWYHVPGSRFGRDDLDLFFINTVVWLGKESFPYRWLGSDIRAGEQREQVDWLTEKLACSTARYKLVFGHHGIYSIGPHGGSMRMRDLDVILRTHGVTAYVSGHDHCLYHISRDGMHYICSGGGSKVLATYTGGPRSGCVLKNSCGDDDSTFPYWHWFGPDAGFASFDVDDAGLSFELIRVHDLPGSRHRRTIGRADEKAAAG